MSEKEKNNSIEKTKKINKWKIFFTVFIILVFGASVFGIAYGVKRVNGEKEKVQVVSKKVKGTQTWV
jgi:ABC-type sulfate transport system permease subunit